MIYYSRKEGMINMVLFLIGFFTCWVILAFVALIAEEVNGMVDGFAEGIITLPALIVYFPYTRIQIWRDNKKRKERGEEV